MRGRVAIPAPTFPSRDLVGHHEILLDPVDRRGLIAAPAFVVREGLALVALLDGGVVVQGRGGVLPLGGQLMHESRVDAGQPLEGGVLGRDVGHLPGGPLGLRVGDQLLVVEGVEEVAEAIGGGEATPQEPPQPAIGLEHGDVVEAVAARREEQDQGLDLLRLRVAALPRADVDVLGDRLV
jgi:hypothetical protein